MSNLRAEIARFLLITLCAVALFGCGTTTGPQAAPSSSPSHRLSHDVGRTPNVVLLMADDLGWADVGFNGNRVIQTPCLDALAAQGMRFERFYAQSPVCSPTRGSCLTGRHPFRYGVFSANVGHLLAKEESLAELLRARGYVTGHFGKWHLGTMTNDYSGKRNRKPQVNHMTPGMAGFDEWCSTEYAVSTWDPYDPANKHGSFDVRNLYWTNGVNITDGQRSGFTGDDSRIIVDHAIPFVQRAVSESRPFFLVAWFHAPHAPVVGGPGFRALYSDRTIDEQHYFACITAMDQQIGRLHGELQRLGVSNDTLIAFCSDNGPEGNPGPRRRFRGSSGEFRGRKRSLYEGGVRVPGVFTWPGRIPAGTSTQFPATTSDYLPTVLELVGMPPSERTLDGISLRAVLEGQPGERGELIFFQTHQQRTAVGARFKLVHNQSRQRPRHDNGETPFAAWELYDLVEDPEETIDIIDRRPQVASELRAALGRFVASCAESLRGADESD